MLERMDGIESPTCISAALRPVFLRYPEVRLALLFGSRSRGEGHEDSDVDIALLVDAPDRIVRLDRLDLAAELSRACQRDVDLVALEQAGVPLLEELIRDAKPLYERDLDAFVRWRSGVLIDLETDRPWYSRMEKAWLKRIARPHLVSSSVSKVDAGTSTATQVNDPTRKG